MNTSVRLWRTCVSSVVTFRYCRTLLQPNQAFCTAKLLQSAVCVVIGLVTNINAVMAQVIFMSDSQLLDMHQAAMTHPDQDTDWGSFSSRATTAVLSDFPAACNCAVPSPDGQWIAVVGDAGCLQLLHASQGYVYDTSKPKKQKSAMLNFGAKRPRRTSQSRPRSNVSPGVYSSVCVISASEYLVHVSSPCFCFLVSWCQRLDGRASHLFIKCNSK